MYIIRVYTAYKIIAGRVFALWVARWLRYYHNIILVFDILMCIEEAEFCDLYIDRTPWPDDIRLYFKQLLL